MPATDLAAQPIRSRAALTSALKRAARLEHQVLVEYLFAAMSMKQMPSEQLTDAQFERVREWKRTLLTIARQEMAHLGNVCNLLLAIGEEPHLLPPTRSASPAPAYPLDYRLQRFSEPFLDRMIRIEASLDVTDDATRVKEGTIGDLYSAIAEGFTYLAKAAERGAEPLFRGSGGMDNTRRWGARGGPGGFNVVPVNNLPSALACLNLNRYEGQGDLTAAGRSHHGELAAIEHEYREQRRSSLRFQPARRVVDDPVLWASTDTATITVIEARTPAAGTAELYNTLYMLLLALLSHIYTDATTIRAPSEWARDCAKHLMTAVLLPVGEVLTTLPAGNSSAGMAGPTFELKRADAMQTYKESRHSISDALEAAAAHARRLRASATVPRRLDFVSRNLDLMAARVRNSAQASG